jgi:hypothetical protein
VNTFLNDPSLKEVRNAVTAAGLPLYPVEVIYRLPSQVVDDIGPNVLALYNPVLNVIWRKPGINESVKSTCTVHEYAHAIFEHAIDGDLDLRRKIEHILEECIKSNAIQNFAFEAEMIQKAMRMGSHVGDRDPRVYQSTQKMGRLAQELEYVLDPDEVFARAIEQYVSSGWMPQHWQVSMDPEEGLAALRWDDRSFQPIGAVIAREFPPQGSTRPTPRPTKTLSDLMGWL